MYKSLIILKLMSELNESPKPPKTPKYSGIESSEQGPMVTITRTDIPWLDTEREAIRLAKVKVPGGGTGYIGNFHRGKLQDIAREIDSRHSEIANKVFYTRIPNVIDGQTHQTVRPIGNPVTRRPIFYIKDGEMRVYFMIFDELVQNNGNRTRNEREHVIIRIATCHKTRNSQENKVLSVISKDSLPDIKRRTGV